MKMSYDFFLDRELARYLASTEPHHHCRECDCGLGPEDDELCDDCQCEIDGANEDEDEDEEQ